MVDTVPCDTRGEDVKCVHYVGEKCDLCIVCKKSKQMPLLEQGQIPSAGKLNRLTVRISLECREHKNCAL
jgi:hypothetical protein